jgi:hypothetical protein
MPRNREKQQFVKASGTMHQIIETIANEVYDRGGDDDDLRQILDEDGVMKEAVAKHIMELAIPRCSWHGRTYQVELSGESSGVLVAAGLYARVDERIRSRSASESPTTGTRQLGLLKFERTPTWSQVNRACIRAGVSIARMWELEAFGASYRNSPAPTQHIIAFELAGGGSEATCVPYLSSLWRGGSQEQERVLRYATLGNIAQLPNEDCYYLVVKKEQ